jgi:hypothetical protein
MKDKRSRSRGAVFARPSYEAHDPEKWFPVFGSDHAQKSHFQKRRRTSAFVRAIRPWRDQVAQGRLRRTKERTDGK